MICQHIKLQENHAENISTCLKRSGCEFRPLAFPRHKFKPNILEHTHQPTPIDKIKLPLYTLMLLMNFLRYSLTILIIDLFMDSYESPIRFIHITKFIHLLFLSSSFKDWIPFKHKLIQFNNVRQEYMRMFKCYFENYKQISILGMKSIEVRLVGRFRFERKLPGEHEHLLYTAIHTQNQSYVFLKGDQCKKKYQPGKLTILQEGKILQTMQGGIGIPHMHWCGQQQDYNFIVIEELSTDYSKLLTRCGGKFSLKTSLMFGIEAISILQYYHFKNFIHCQLKPQHFMMGSGSKCMKLFLIDFSSSIRYRQNQTLEHIGQNQKNTDERFTNMQFSSQNYHLGNTPSRKDDIISLLFLLAYFQQGSLPWSKYMGNNKMTQREKSEAILKIKGELDEEDIFFGCPDLAVLYETTMKLKFDEKPRYSYYKNVFRQRLERQGEIEDQIYDWILLPNEQQEPLQNLGLDLEIIPNQTEFLKQLGEQIRSRQRIQAQKLSLTKTMQPKKQNPKDKDCTIF